MMPGMTIKNTNRSQSFSSESIVPEAFGKEPKLNQTEQRECHVPTDKLQPRPSIEQFEPHLKYGGAGGHALAVRRVNKELAEWCGSWMSVCLCTFSGGISGLNNDKISVNGLCSSQDFKLIPANGTCTESSFQSRPCGRLKDCGFVRPRNQIGAWRQQRSDDESNRAAGLASRQETIAFTTRPAMSVRR